MRSYRPSRTDLYSIGALSIKMKVVLWYMMYGGVDSDDHDTFGTWSHILLERPFFFGGPFFSFTGARGATTFPGFFAGGCTAGVEDFGG
jgi:hypothetical protein